jgi:hypothetical protein
MELLGKETGQTTRLFAADTSDGWTAFLQGMRGITWTAPKEGAGPVLAFQFPDDVEEPANTSRGKVIRGYLQARVPRDGIAAFDAETLGGQLKALSAKKGGSFSEHSVTVNLAALAQEGADVASAGFYASLGASGLAEAFTPLLTEMSDSQATYALITMQNEDPLPLPKTGVMLKPSSGSSKFKFINDTDDPVYVKLARLSGNDDTGEGETVCVMFVRPDDKLSVSMRPGYYRVSLAAGMAWFGEEELFGDNGDYTVYEKPYRLQANYIHSITHYYGEEAKRGHMTFNGVDLSQF